MTLPLVNKSVEKMFKLKVVTAQVFTLLVILYANSAQAISCGGYYVNPGSFSPIIAACDAANDTSDCSVQTGTDPCTSLYLADGWGSQTTNVASPGPGCSGDEICFSIFYDTLLDPLPDNCTESGGVATCTPPPDDPSETGDCEDKEDQPYTQYCGAEQACYKLDCRNGCALQEDSIDTSGDLITVFNYSYTGGACGDEGPGSANDDLVAQNLPPGSELLDETTVTTTESQTNPDGSTTTVTTTQTVTQSTNNGSSAGGGATAEEIGDELTEATPASTDYTGDMDGAFDQLNDEYDSAEDALDDPNDFTGSTDTGLLTSLLPNSGCTGTLTLPSPGGENDYLVTCSDTEVMRGVLAWILGLYSALFIFNLITSRPS